MSIANEYTLTDLLRSPNVVTEAADRASQLIIHRRNAPDLLLMRADRQHWDFDGAAGTGKLLAVLLGHLTSSDALDAIGTAMPWANYLSEEGRAAFASELAQALAASAELSSFAPVGQMLAEWKATAAIQADPDLADALSRPIEEPTGGIVPEP
jgi:hypothetical protein